MASRPRGLLIVSVSEVEDIARMKRRIAEISGVLTVRFNQINQKMLVRYEGDAEAMERISLGIKGIIEEASSNVEGIPPSSGGSNSSV